MIYVFPSLSLHHPPANMTQSLELEDGVYLFDVMI